MELILGQCLLYPKAHDSRPPHGDSTKYININEAKPCPIFLAADYTGLFANDERQNK
jgi:hypothetical protein